LAGVTLYYAGLNNYDFAEPVRVVEMIVKGIVAATSQGTAK